MGMSVRMQRLKWLLVLLVCLAWQGHAGNDVIFLNGFEVVVVEPPAVDSPTQDFGQGIEFLYTPPGADQIGVDIDSIDPDRVAVIRGKVMRDDGSALSGVTVTILDHPEYGSTRTAADGWFNMAANGGTSLVMEFSLDDYLPVQRRVQVPWNDYTFSADVVMIQVDPVSTVVSMSSTSTQTARGTMTSDDRGQRTPTLIFPAQTAAKARTKNGVMKGMESLTVRTTEYTVGDMGPSRMPGVLPATSGYTHAVELSADEVGADGWIEFDEPVYYYLENFLDFPVGVTVPSGYYDRDEGLWLAGPDGLVIEVLDTGAGIAEVDVDGDGVADTGQVLVDLSFTDGERQQLAGLYTNGTTLWRVPIPHFTPWDHNWPFGPPPGADGPPDDDSDDPSDDNNQTDDPCEQSGSVIFCEDQLLGESLPVVGTEYQLFYNSSRVPDFKKGMTSTIRVTGDTLPAEPPIGADVTVDVAGVRTEASFDLLPLPPGLEYLYEWDGLDAFERPLNSVQPGLVTVAYRYATQYFGSAGSFTQSFANIGNGVAIGASDSGSEISLAREYPITVGIYDARQTGLGGWTFGVHHAFDANANVLHQGDGIRRQLPRRLIDTFDEGDALELTLAPDGTLLFVTGNQIVRLGADGFRRPVAGTGRSGSDGNDGPPLLADMSPGPMVQADDGTIYFIDRYIWGQVRSIGPDNIARKVAGNPLDGGYTGDGGPAVDALLADPEGLGLGPDGALYVSDSLNHAIRRIDANGIIETVAGGNGLGYSGDGENALDAQLWSPSDLAVAPDGSVYFADNRDLVVRVLRPDGTIDTVAGNGDVGLYEDGVEAINAPIRVTRLALGPDGSIYISSSGVTSADGQTQYNDQIRRITPDGIINRYAGVSTPPAFSGDGGPANLASLNDPIGIAVAPDNSVFIADAGNDRIRVVRPNGQSLQVNQEFLVPSEDGGQVFVFDLAGVHLRTIDALSGRVLFTFNYDDEGQLASVTNAIGEETRVEFDSDGIATGIVSPGGLRSEVVFDKNGFLTRLENPAGFAHNMTYTTGGLLLTFEDARGNASIMSYDTQGLLLTDTNRFGNDARLERSESDLGYEVAYIDAQGASFVYGNARDADGALVRSFTSPSGAVTATVVRTDDLATTAYPDGVTITAQQSPDPRWGQGASYISQALLELPSGLTKTISSERTVQLTEPANPLSMQHLRETIVTNGETRVWEYDVGQRRLTDTSPAGRFNQWQYDAEGRLVSIGNDDFDDLTFTYDANGRPISRVQGDMSLTYGYDSANRVATKTNGAGETRSYVYDDRDRLTQFIFPSGRTVEAGYDANGNRTSVTMPSGAVHTVAFSEMDRESAYTPPGATESFVIDQLADGAERALTLPSGREISGRFDNTRRFTGWVYPEGEVTFDYLDETTRVQLGTWAPTSGDTQTVSLGGYDGPFISAVRWDGPATARYSYQYDNNFRLTQRRFEDNVEQLYTYDVDGQKTGQGPFTFVLDGPAGTVSSITDGTLTVDFTYDGIGRLVRRVHTINGSVVSDLTIDHDNAPRITQTQLVIDGGTVERNFGYDLDGQLIEVSDAIGVIESYIYDVNGNRTLREAGVVLESATYDVRDRIQTQGGVAYTVDGDGMLTARGGDSYTYSTRGELLSATVNGTTADYTYDAFRRRVAHNVGADTWSYVYGDFNFTLQITGSIDPTGVNTEYYYDEGGQLFAFVRESDWYYVVTDQVGSPIAVYDATGAQVKRIVRDTWGAVVSDSAPAFELLVGYAGGLVDPTTGFVTFGLRDYDPETGRFTTLDPLRFRSGAINLYGYANNDPVSRTDPSGLFTFGGSAYNGIGGGASISIANDLSNIGGCIELGVGGGAGISLDPLGTPDTSYNIDASASATVNGAGLDGNLGLKFVPCADGGAQIRNNTQGGVKLPGVSAGLDTDGGVGVSLEPPTFDTEIGAKLSGTACISLF